MDFLKALTENSGDWGRMLLVSTFPALREWIRDEVIEQIDSGKGFSSDDE